LLAQLSDVFPLSIWELIYWIAFGVPPLALLVGVLLWRRGRYWKPVVAWVFYLAVGFFIFFPFDNKFGAIVWLILLAAGPVLTAIFLLPLGRSPRYSAHFSA